MIKRKISEIMDKIDEEYINEALDYVRLKPSPCVVWTKWGILAAGFAVAVIAGAIVLPSFWESNVSEKGELVTLEEMNRPYHDLSGVKELVIGLQETFYPSTSKWPAKYLTLDERCNFLSFHENFYDIYRYADESLIGEMIGEGECNIYDSTVQIGDNLVGKETFEVYELNGVSEELMVAVKLEDKFWMFKNRYRQPETFGDWVDIYNLSDNLELNCFEISDEKQGKSYFSLEDDSYIWNILLEYKDAEGIKTESSKGNSVNFIATMKHLDIYDKFFCITEAGYIDTNLFGDGMYFIGEEAAGKIISYVTENGKETEYEPCKYSIAGIITEIAEDYILINDSVLCENPKDGISFKVPTEEIKVRRYVECYDMQVGDLIWINFREGIDTKAENLVYGVYEISRAISSSLIYREYEIGTEYSAGSIIEINKELLVQVVSTPETILVFYNDEILWEKPFSEEELMIELEKTGYYGFYARDEEGELHNIGKACMYLKSGNLFTPVKE